MLKKDLRDTPLYREAEELYLQFRQPGTGQISDAADIHVAPDGEHAVFAGAIMDRLEGGPATRICRVHVPSGSTQVLTFGPNEDRLPKYSPDGRTVAFLSDRKKTGDFQLFLLDPHSGRSRSTPRVEGWVEYLQWSPDGRRVLLGVAGHGADVSGGQGAIASQKESDTALSWMPTLDSGDEEFRWRRLWIYDIQSNETRMVSNLEVNVWEAVWLGNSSIAAIVSPGPSEGLWYTARLCRISIETGATAEIYAPRDQIGWPAASPSGHQLAVVEAICSDRLILAGDLLLADSRSWTFRPVDTHGVDVTYAEWRSEELLLLAGHRGFETVVGVYNRTTAAFTETWSSVELSSSPRYMAVSGFNSQGDCLLVAEGFAKAPEIGAIRESNYATVRSFDIGYSQCAKAIKAIERVQWSAPDGLEIQGWLLLPRKGGPYPLIMNIHGGPVSHWRPMWLGRRLAPVLMLIERGYAIFLPNPRGSSGRGQAFARRVLGDMGGADTYDYLSGIDHLVEVGIADPRRLGVTGGSYGGFITSWLVTQDDRFAAAVSVAPVTNHVTEHLVSNIPHFVSLFLNDSYRNPSGKYFQRSPIMHAHKVRTPILNVCGALDRCTPPEEAIQFHNALRESSAPSVLVTYPQEGHGVRKLPAAIDYTARMVAWFEEYMPPDAG